MNKNCKPCKPSIIIPDKYSVVVVQNITERNHISCKIRQNGTIAVVVEEGYAQYQIRTKEGLYSVCDNNAWVQISTGDRVFDGSNLIILNNEEHKQKYLQSGLAVVGQMIFYVPEQKYYRYDGYNFVDPFYNKLDKDGYEGTAQDLKTEIDGKANTDASNIDDNLHIWRQKIDANYVHDQAQPSSIWTINHPLNKKVSVTITDTAGTVIEGQVIIKDNSQVIITFNNPFSGIAVLN